MSKEQAYTVEVTTLPGSEVEIKGSLPFVTLATYEAKALEHIGAHVEIPGFRKGKVPADMLKKQIGTQALLEEQTEYALSELYPTIIASNKIDAIGRPEIMITKLTEGNPVEFKIKTAVMPELKLPEYKKLATEALKNENAEVTVTDEEVEATIMNIRKSRKAHEHDGDHAHEQHDHDHNHDDVKEEDLPPFNDEYVAQLGDFKTVENFKTKLRENIKAEKEHQANEKKRIAVIEAVLGKTEGDIPGVLVEGELER